MLTDSTSPAAAVLVRAGRSALQPTGTDRDRIASALRVRLDAASAELEPALWIAMARGLAGPTVAAVVVGLTVGGLFVASSFQDREVTGPTSRPATTADSPLPLAQLPPAPPAVTPASPSELQPAVPAPAPSVARLPRVEQAGARGPQPASDRLAEEVEIMSRAQQELHAGRFAASLRVLEEHAQKFAQGILAPERRATRIQALCGLGRSAEADVEIGNLGQGSLHERRVREACSAARKQAEN
jgi:hypothetical protein